MGSNLNFEVAAPGTSDKVTISNGTAGLTLNGGQVNVTDTGRMAIGTYVIMDYTTTAGLAGGVGNMLSEALPQVLITTSLTTRERQTSS